MFTIGIDIGGMSIKFGIVNENGKILAQSRIKPAKTAVDGVNEMIAEVKRLIIENKISMSEIKGVGVGCPGTVDNKAGIVEGLHNLGWERIEIVSIMSNALGVPIKLVNDASAATLAEVIYGAAKDYEEVIMFTLGTGVGGGMVVGGKLYDGGWERGGELGHTTLILGGKPCNCGRNGCVEKYVSATAFIEQTKEAMLENKDSSMWIFVDGDINKVDGRTAFECSKQGDKTANKVIDKYVSYLAESMMNMFNIFRPQAFILGGGVSAAGKYLTDKVKAYCEKYNYGYANAPKTEILIATLGNDAGIIGAAALFNS